MRTALKCKKNVAVILSLIFLCGAAQARVINFTSRLDGNQAANGAGIGSPATGTVSASLDTDTLVFSWSAGYTGLTGTITAAHFHGPATPNASAPPTVFLTTANPDSGTQVITQAQADDLQNGLWYLNVHTTAFAGDEIRGQLGATPQAVPATNTWALLAMILGLLVLVAPTLLKRSRV